jgi:iron(III) transport system substrate-binding protein
MRQWIAIILLCVGLALPFILRAALSTPETPAAASAERLVIITANTQDIRRAFAQAFLKWYREKFGLDVVLDFRVPGGANDISRQLDTTYRAARSADGTLPANFHPDIDMVWGGGDYFFDVELKRRDNVLEPMDIDPSLLQAAFPQPTLAGVKLYDYQTSLGAKQRPTWVGLCLSSMGIIYNPDVYRSLGISPPATWTDLANEKLNGLIALADPSHSASVALAYMMVVQSAMADAEGKFAVEHGVNAAKEKSKLMALPGYREAIERGWEKGMETLQRIAVNARYFTAWGSQVPNDVGGGDAAAGIGIDFYGRVYAEEVGENRCQFVAPSGATSTTPDPIGILAGVRGKQYELANRFVEFLLSREGQNLWIVRAGEAGGPMERSLRRLPIRRDAYADQNGWTDHVNPFEQAHGFNQRNDWMSLFADTRVVWTAAWIDCREELRDAHAAIMDVKDASRRERLLADLATLPISMGDVAKIAAERSRLQREAGSDLPGFAAKQEIALAEKFRKHYRKVEKMAQNQAI